MHADHTVGLKSSWNLNNYKIYCSELTKKLVVGKCKINSDLVDGVPLDESVIMNHELG